MFKFVCSNAGFRFSPETIDDEMEGLTEFQVWVGLGFCLQVFRMKDRAPTILEKLWPCSSRLLMRLERGLTGVVMVRLMVCRGGRSDRREAHFLVGQDSFG